MALIKTINRNGEMLTPHIADDVFMAENATVVGDVTVGEGSSLWFNSVLRGDVNTIVIGKHCNIQDGAVLHTLYQKSTHFSSLPNRYAWPTPPISNVTVPT